jgi:hypothetical protein
MNSTSVTKEDKINGAAAMQTDGKTAEDLVDGEKEKTVKKHKEGWS